MTAGQAQAIINLLVMVMIDMTVIAGVGVAALLLGWLRR